jgi:hypothetical protein
MTKIIKKIRIKNRETPLISLVIKNNEVIRWVWAWDDKPLWYFVFSSAELTIFLPKQYRIFIIFIYKIIEQK